MTQVQHYNYDEGVLVTLNTHIIEKPALEHWIYCDCMVSFFACFFYSLSLPLYFAFGQYFLPHSPCLCICECLRVRPLILVLVETETLICRTSFSLSLIYVMFQNLHGGGGSRYIPGLDFDRIIILFT